MEEDTKKDEDTGIQEKAYKLLSSVSKGKDLTVRDDQYEFSWLLDSVKIARKRGCRFRLVDSGQLDFSQLEWLAKAGADLYTSDEVRTDAFELDLLSRACRKAGSIVAYFHNGPLEHVNEGEESLPITFSALLNLTRSGVYLHLTNKENKRDSSHLNSISHACQRGGSWLVYYHHGPLDPVLEELARNGAWIHVSDRSLKGEEDVPLLMDTIKSARSAGTNVVLHLEEGIDARLFEDMVKTGAFILFNLSHLEDISPLRARKKSLDFRAYYLYPHFLPR